jgi:sulfite reductase (NADPH) flavoprotein alpha-component
MHASRGPAPASSLRTHLPWGSGFVQDVRHLEVELAGSTLTYAAGDSLAMWPQTAPDAVERFLTRCGAWESRLLVWDMCEL